MNERRNHFAREGTDRRITIQSWRGLWPLAAILIAAGVLRILLAGSSAPVDDAFITLRYARNLAAGHGLVYHPGDPVFALSGPLYAALLAPFYFGGGTPEPVLPGIAILADLGVVVLVHRLAARFAGAATGLLAAAICGLFPWQALACGQGMETQIFMLFTFAAFVGAAEGRWKMAAALSGCATLTRPEGLIVSAMVALAAVLRRARPFRPGWAALAVWGVVVLPWVAYATRTYGSPLPTSILAKSRRSVPAGVVLDYFVTGNPLLLLVWAGALLGLVVLWFDAQRPVRGERWQRFVSPERSAPALCAAWAIAYVTVFFAGRPSLLGAWYRPPVVPALCVLAAIGAASLARGVGRGRVRPAFLLTLAGICWVGLCAAAVPRVFSTAATHRREVETVDRPLGEWIRDHTAPGDTVLAGDIGYVGYLSDRPVLDLGGLVSPPVLRFLRSNPHDDRVGVELAVRRRPCVFVGRDSPELRPRLEDPAFRAAFALAAAFPATGAETSGEDSEDSAERPGVSLVYLRR